MKQCNAMHRKCPYADNDGRCRLSCRCPVFITPTYLLDNTEFELRTMNPDPPITDIPRNYTAIEALPQTYEDKLTEEKAIQTVIDFLESHGIQVITDYGFYRDTYDILKDMSAQWDSLVTSLRKESESHEYLS